MRWQNHTIGSKHWYQGIKFIASLANDISDIREHARQAQLAIYSVSEVKTIIDPADTNTGVSIAPTNHVQK